MKTRLSRSFAVLFVVLLSFLSFGVLVVKAQSKSLWVPNMYPTIQEAIEAAKNGDKIYIRGGTFDGPQNQTLVIDKSISLIGETAQTTTLTLHPPTVNHHIWGQTYSNSIKIVANNVKLSGLTINSGGGILSISGNDAQVIHSSINTQISVTGIRSQITHNILPSLFLKGSEHTISNNNVSGTYSPLWLEDSVDNIITENKITGDVGVHLRSSTGNQFISNQIVSKNCIQIDNYVGITHEQTRLSDNNVFFKNTFMGESKNIVAYNSVNNTWDNGREGNYWSDYAGTDLDEDGIGDIPYVIDLLNEDNYPLMLPYDVEHDSIVLPSPKPELEFPSTIALASIIIGVTAGIGIILYFKKRRI